MKAGTLMEFNPRSVLACEVSADLGLQHGDLVLIVGWVDDKAAVKIMRRPVTQAAIDEIMNVSLQNDFDVGKDALERHFVPANRFIHGNLVHITKQELFEMFPGYEPKLERLIADNPMIVVFENQNFDSSELGMKTAVAIGPGRTYKSLDEIEGKWLNDLPSQRQYPHYVYEQNDE